MKEKILAKVYSNTLDANITFILLGICSEHVHIGFTVFTTDGKEDLYAGEVAIDKDKMLAANSLEPAVEAMVESIVDDIVKNEQYTQAEEARERGEDIGCH